MSTELSKSVEHHHSILFCYLIRVVQRELKVFTLHRFRVNITCTRVVYVQAKLVYSITGLFPNRVDTFSEIKGISLWTSVTFLLLSF